jgi:hypothetical protein
MGNGNLDIPGLSRLKRPAGVEPSISPKRDLMMDFLLEIFLAIKVEGHLRKLTTMIL